MKKILVSVAALAVLALPQAATANHPSSALERFGPGPLSMEEMMMATHGPDMKSKFHRKKPLGTMLRHIQRLRRPDDVHVVTPVCATDTGFVGIVARPTNPLGGGFRDMTAAAWRWELSFADFWLQEASNRETPTQARTAIRWRCSPPGEIRADVVNLPYNDAYYRGVNPPYSAGEDAFDRLAWSLYGMGYNNLTTDKYAVYYDSNSDGIDLNGPAPGGLACGQGSWYNDHQDNYGNYANQNGGWAFVYNCTDGEGGFILHEIGHTLGAVLSTSPHTTGIGHCYDEWDVMCYDEDCPGACSSPGIAVECGPGSSWPFGDLQFDCHYDDYMSMLHTTDSTFIGQHYNIGECYPNRFQYFYATCGNP